MLVVYQYLLLSSSKFVNDKWMADHKFMDLAEFQEKQWYVHTYVNCFKVAIMHKYYVCLHVYKYCEVYKLLNITSFVFIAGGGMIQWINSIYSHPKPCCQLIHVLTLLT